MSQIVAGGVTRKLTCKVSTPEQRAKFPLMLEPPSTFPLPERVPFLTGLPKFDQEGIGACVANAIVKMALRLAVKTLMMGGMSREDAIEAALPFILSRLQLYFNNRKAEGTDPWSDSGSQVVTGLQVFTQIGICFESSYDYTDPERRFGLTPPQATYVEAALNRALLYFHLPDNESMLRSLADDFTFVIAMPVYQYMESEPCSSNGIIRCPTPDDGDPLGYHCVHIDGYDVIAGQRYKNLDNSWGNGVALEGNYLLHDDYPIWDAFSLRWRT